MAATPDLAELERMSARFAPVHLKVDTSGLSPGDRKALDKLIAAARIVDRLMLRQLWSGNPGLYQKLQQDKSPLGKARLHYYWLNKGPWSAIDEWQAFIPGVPDRKPMGANFYPEGMTKADFEAWVKTLSPAERKEAEGFFTVIRPSGGKLRPIPYSQEYRSELEELAGDLKAAAALTGNASLRKFLELRAAALLSNDYYASDVAWMDMDAPIDVTIGPYETYNDELFGYKAAFEAYVTLRDEAETEKLKFFSGMLQEIENNLPIDSQYKNPKLGASTPIRVVNEVISSGDAAKGVRTAAFNLPNDERVISEKGSKKVMLKNVQEAKFEKTLIPLSRIALPAALTGDVSFDSFFTHILAHELAHGIGPHQIKVNGRETTPRQELKELYSAIEEAKADITGLFMLQYLFDRGKLPAAEKKLYTSFLASSFRTLRFGLNDAHGKGMALQFNYLRDKGGFRLNPDGTFAVDFERIQAAVRDLTHDLLMLEAKGDYAGAQKLLEKDAVIRPEMKKMLDRMKEVPVDIDPSAGPISAQVKR